MTQDGIRAEFEKLFKNERWFISADTLATLQAENARLREALDSAVRYMTACGVNISEDNYPEIEQALNISVAVSCPVKSDNSKPTSPIINGNTAAGNKLSSGGVGVCMFCRLPIIKTDIGQHIVCKCKR